MFMTAVDSEQKENDPQWQIPESLGAGFWVCLYLGHITCIVSSSQLKRLMQMWVPEKSQGQMIL